MHVTQGIPQQIFAGGASSTPAAVAAAAAGNAPTDATASSGGAATSAARFPGSAGFDFLRSPVIQQIFLWYSHCSADCVNLGINFSE